jgi:hypothetical protein
MVAGTERVAGANEQVKWHYQEKIQFENQRSRNKSNDGDSLI